MKKSLFLFLCLMIVSLVPNRILYAQETAETPGHTLTIYLDRQNQMAVRMAIGIYEKEKKEAEGTEQASYYPEIQWNLVDKSGLEPEAFQAAWGAWLLVPERLKPDMKVMKHAVHILHHMQNQIFRGVPHAPAADFVSRPDQKFQTYPVVKDFKRTEQVV